MSGTHPEKPPAGCRRMKVDNAPAGHRRIKKGVALILVLSLTHGAAMSSSYEYGFRQGKNAHRAHLEEFELDPSRPGWETQKWHQYATRLERTIERLEAEIERLRPLAESGEEVP